MNHGINNYNNINGNYNGNNGNNQRHNGNNGNNQRHNGNNGNNQRQNFRPRYNRNNRYPPNARINNPAQPPIAPPRNNQPAAAFDGRNNFGNNRAERPVDRISPAISPIVHNNGSPIHHGQSNPGLENAAALWHGANAPSAGHWSPTPSDLLPYPTWVPSLNGSPYAGGPTTSSPVGSSRSSSDWNSTPPQVISGSSSPMMSDDLPAGMNDDRRPSAEEMMRNLFHANRASSSQSPDIIRSCPPTQRPSSGYFDDRISSGNYYQSGRSSESRSSEDLSLENIMGEFRASPDSGVVDANRLSNSSDSTRCNECTMDRVCHNCNAAMPANAVGRVDSNQNTPRIQEISSAMAALNVAPCNQGIPKSKQLPISAPNQRGLSNRQVGNTRKQQQQPSRSCPVARQPAISEPTDRSDDEYMTALSPVPFLNQRVIEQPILYCIMHKPKERSYCQTCSRIFCNNCEFQNHVAHVILYIDDAMASAQKQAEDLIVECAISIDTLKKDIDKGEKVAHALEKDARCAARSVRDLTSRLIEAVRARERKLIELIETTRQSKRQALQVREDELRMGLLSLHRTIDRLTRSLKAATATKNPFDLQTVKDTASALLFFTTCKRHFIQSVDDQYVNFDFVDTAVLQALEKLGSVTCGNGHIGDRRLLAPMSPLARPMTPITRGRAIAGARFAISILDRRLTVGGLPYESIEHPIMDIGNKFTLLDDLCRPWGVACDPQGHILVADRSNNRIQVFRRDGTLVRRFGCHGTGRGQFDRPAGITVDARRRVIVADKDNHRVQVLTMEGEFLLAFGEKGSSAGLFNYPWDVATNDACQIVVSDTRNHRIQMFSAEGTFLRQFGFDKNVMWKHFDAPRGVTFNTDGTILVTDFNNHRIVVVEHDFLNARILGCDSLVPHPMPLRLLQRPQGIAIDDKGHIIVCDSRNNRVLILNNKGKCLREFGPTDKQPKRLDRPSGVAVTPDGKIAVVDFGHNRVVLF